MQRSNDVLQHLAKTFRVPLMQELCPEITVSLSEGGGGPLHSSTSPAPRQPGVYQGRNTASLQDRSLPHETVEGEEGKP